MNILVTSVGIRGYLIKYANNKWAYDDTNESIDIIRPCARCGKMPTEEGYDACLGYIEGVKSACCGHGVHKPIIVYLK